MLKKSMKTFSTSTIKHKQDIYNHLIKLKLEEKRTLWKNKCYENSPIWADLNLHMSPEIVISVILFAKFRGFEINNNITFFLNTSLFLMGFKSVGSEL